MERILIKNLKEYKNKKVSISASVDVARNQGKMAFFDFRDRTGKVQGVVFGKPDILEIAKTLSPETVVRVIGVVNERPEKMRKKGIINGDIELEITDIKILSKAEPLPFDLDSNFNIETLLDYRPITMRREHDRAIFDIQHTIVQAYRTFLSDNGFIEFQAPKLVGGDAEGGAEVFKVEYFKDREVSLATSPQLYKQIMVGVFERVFAIGSTFRAEKSATSRHLTEYISLDAEFGFIADHLDVMRIKTNLMRYLVKEVSEKCSDQLKVLEIESPLIPSEEDIIPYMKLREAQNLIKEKTGIDKTNEPDLEPEDERFLCEYAYKKFKSDFIFITHYPVSKRPFYTMEDENDPGFTKSFDLLFRGVEISTGGQRVHDPKIMKEKMKEKNLNPEAFSFYLQAFKYGLPPHGGWGMGLERLTQKFCGVKNVKQASVFPRDINRIDTLLSSNKKSDKTDTNNSETLQSTKET